MKDLAEAICSYLQGAVNNAQFNVETRDGYIGLYYEDEYLEDDNFEGCSIVCRLDHDTSAALYKELEPWISEGECYKYKYQNGFKTWGWSQSYFQNSCICDFLFYKDCIAIVKPESGWYGVDDEDQMLSDWFGKDHEVVGNFFYDRLKKIFNLPEDRGGFYEPVNYYLITKFEYKDDKLLEKLKDTTSLIVQSGIEASRDWNPGADLWRPL